MIQVTRLGTVFRGSKPDMDRLGAEFAEESCVTLEGFLEPELVTIVQTRIEQSDFYDRIHEQIGPNKELCMVPGFVHNLLHLLLNRRELFELIHAISQCEHIGSFRGRVYRVVPNHGHFDDWHDDLVDYRLVGMSINLSTERYSGGLFQLRDCSSGQIINEIANVGFGDAILFKLASHLEHRITPVEGIASKTAFAGWFKSQPHFLDLLKAQDDPGSKDEFHRVTTKGS